MQSKRKNYIFRYFRLVVLRYSVYAFLRLCVRFPSFCRLHRYKALLLPVRIPAIAVPQFSAEQKGLSAAEYWRVHGSRHPPALRAVAQAVFGCPASAGVIERDFCIADWFMPRKRGSLDPAYLEMCLFLRAQFGFISNDVPAMSAAEAKAAVPTRLRDQAKLDEVNVLSFEAEKESDVVVEDNDTPWVLPL